MRGARRRRIPSSRSGVSPAGALAAAAHTGAVAGDHRVFRALVEEAGAVWAEDVHELLELAKAQAVPAARPRSPVRGGLAVLTCSGGDSALAADYCARNGLDLPPLAPATATRLRELLPDAATVGNPLDYTALIWGEVDTLRDIVVAVGEDPAIDQVVVFYDQPVGIDGEPAQSWAAVREGIHAGAAASPVPVDGGLHPPRAARRRRGRALRRRGHTRRSPASAPAWCCAAALRRCAGDPARLRAIGAARGARAGATATVGARRARGQGAAARRRACRWWRAAWRPARTTPPAPSRTWGRRWR